MTSNAFSRILTRRRMVAGGAAAAAAGSVALVAGGGIASAAPGGNRLQDESDVKQLTVNYALGTDMIAGGDKPGGLAIYNVTFTADAKIAVSGNPPTIGPGAWADFVETALAAYAVTQHLVGTINVVFSGNGSNTTAAMSTYLHATHRNDTTSQVFEFIGVYRDVVIQTKNGWRISERTLFPTLVEFRDI